MAKSIFENKGSLFSHEILREKFFVDTVNDLFLKTNFATDYDIIRAAGLVRQLVKESGGQSLVHKVARPLKFKLKFRTNNTPLDLSKYATSSQTIVVWNPFYYSNGDSMISLDKFLKATCIYLKDKKNDVDMNITVRDIIDILAHSHGGIHYEEPDSNAFYDRKLIKDIRRFDTLFGNIGIYVANIDSDIYKVAVNIYKVILDALSPLVQIIKQKLRQEKPSGYFVSEKVKMISKEDIRKKTSEN